MSFPEASPLCPDTLPSSAETAPLLLSTLSAAARQQAMARFQIIQPFVERGVPLPEVARHHNVALRTARRWVQHYRAGGLVALSRPRRATTAVNRSICSAVCAAGRHRGHPCAGHPPVWSPASTVYWAGQDAFATYRNGCGSQRGTAGGMVGGDAARKDALLSLCTPEGIYRIYNTILIEPKKEERKFMITNGVSLLQTIQHI